MARSVECNRMIEVGRQKPSPVQLKVTSDTDASATPATMGTSDKMTAGGGLSPKKAALRATLKNGSIALTVCVKDTWQGRQVSRRMVNGVLVS